MIVMQFFFFCLVRREGTRVYTFLPQLFNKFGVFNVTSNIVIIINAWYLETYI